MNATRQRDKEELTLNEDTLTLPSISHTQLKIQNLLGKGGYGNVFKAEWQKMEVAVKQLHIETLPFDLLQEFRNEAKLMHKCQHPNIVRFFAISVEQGKDSLVMEYLPKGSLFQNLCDSRIEIPWPTRLSIAIDIATGLNYLHSQNIIHRDLKSMNILLQQDWKAKITDFGMAKIKIATETITKDAAVKGSIRWKAPELFKRGATCTKNSDIYSLGMVLWEIASRKLPFHDEQSDVIVMGFIKDGEKEVVPDECPSFYSDVFLNCWKASQDRPDAASVADSLESNVDKLAKVGQPGQKEYEEGVKLYEEGNYGKSISILKKSADLEYPPALILMKLHYKNAGDEEQQELLFPKISKNIEFFMEKAKSENPRDLVHMGCCYAWGCGVKQSHELAHSLLLKAATKGNPLAQNLIGFYYSQGISVNSDKKKAFDYFNKSADQNFGPGIFNLGCCYQNEIGVTKDIKKAISCYEQSAAQDFTPALKALGLLYEDHSKGFQTFKKGCDLGDVYCAYQVASCYQNGTGVSKDIPQAIHFALLAANKGYKEAKTLHKSLVEEQ